MANKRLILPGSVSPIELAAGIPAIIVPDIIEFVVSDQYLNRPNLYPRQATILKTIFLQDNLYTLFDYSVIDEWSEGFTLNPSGEGADGVFRYDGYHGCQPDILQRIYLNQQAGRKWFRECVVVIGRRGGKGYLGGLCGAYVLWNYLALGDPQGFYGVDRDKKLTGMVFAGKKAQAKTEQFADLVNVVLGSTCFAPYISDPQAESLTIAAPHDVIRQQDLERKGINSSRDMASFQLMPKEATLMAGRGPASFLQFYDELAHVSKSNGASASSEDVWESSTPALDQFKQEAFIFEGSSPWQMLGQFYKNWQQALEVDPNTKAPIYPEKFMVQLESWDPYKDWERASSMKMRKGFKRCFAELKGSMQEYDDNMRKLERANPDTFAIERRCLDPDTKVLTTDLEWKTLEDIEVGDELIGIDELPAVDGPRTQRKLRGSTVLNKWENIDKALRITFEDGSSVICSANHRWLRVLYRGDGTPGLKSWIRSGPCVGDENRKGPKTYLQVGDHICHIVDPWEVDRSWESGYLSGVYDGEGCILKRYRKRQEFHIAFTQNPGIVLNTTLQYLRDKGFNPKSNKNGGRKAMQYKITNLDNCLRFLGAISPLRLLENSRGLWEGRTPGGNHQDPKDKCIISIDELPEQRLIDIETSTGTFIAEGLVSHNSHWATSLSAYLDPDRIKAMFGPWNDESLSMKNRGSLHVLYSAHCDPSKSGANTAIAVAHIEGPDAAGFNHVIFDLIKHWEPGDFPENDNQIDYIFIQKWIEENIIDAFMPNELTFDQFDASIIQRLRAYSNSKERPKRINVYERTATKPLNWAMAEAFKTALGLGLLSAPYYIQAEQELLFLQDVGHERVDHPTEGPVQTKDVFDAMANVTYALIGEQMAAFLGQEFSDFGLHGMNLGETPFGKQMSGDSQAQEIFNQFGNVRRGGQLANQSPSRGMHRDTPNRFNPSAPWLRGQ